MTSGIRGRRLLLQLVGSAIAGSLAGALWLTVAGIVIHSYGPLQAANVLAFGIFFGLVFGCFAGIGIPAYLLARQLKLAGRVSGVSFGIGLGMLVAMGFGCCAALDDWVWSLKLLGLAGAVSAFAFLLTMGRLRASLNDASGQR